MSQKMPVEAHCFIPFQDSVAQILLPEKFTFPFYYEPHPLCLLAAEQLQYHLQTQTNWEHNFGIDKNKKGLVIGKMFGVLVVQNQAGDIGYLAAFSGKLAGGNHHPYFVPPVFDILTKDGFFTKEEEVINELNRQIEALKIDPDYWTAQLDLKAEEALAAERLAAEKQKNKAAKAARKTQRQEAKESLSLSDYEALDEKLKKESYKARHYLKELNQYWKKRLAESQAKVDHFTTQVKALKEQRKIKSATLQKKLFDQYKFLNQTGQQKGLNEIFETTVQKVPPAGAGECAAPKLLQYAFLNQLKPLAMAEFWWGQAPNQEIRKHQQFYPACRGKCEPILAHMLDGIPMDKNPMLTNPAVGKVIDIVYEDEQMLVINKPPEFLSVPGKTIQDSVYLRIKQRFSNATGPLIVHRLDMSTSGLMLIAKTTEAHKYLQHQFIKRTIKKRYVALLDGIIPDDEGLIDLPLHLDFYNRPQQMVCYEWGKPAQTRYKVIARQNERSKIHFFPITGRTHQLRVHAAHKLGLHTPIVGDDLYGKRGTRLCLHAEWIEFRNPMTKEVMAVAVDCADF